MSFTLYDLNSGLDSDDAIEFSRKAILFEDFDINKLKRDNKKEKLNHFITKSVMFFILRELKHNVVTEVEIVGVGTGDLLDIDAKVLYEFETTGTKNVQRKVNEIYKQTGIEVIVINVKEVPDDIFQRYLKLKEYVIPD